MKDAGMVRLWSIVAFSACLMVTGGAPAHATRAACDHTDSRCNCGTPPPPTCPPRTGCAVIGPYRVEAEDGTSCCCADCDGDMVCHTITCDYHAWQCSYVPYPGSGCLGGYLPSPIYSVGVQSTSPSSCP